MATAAPEAKKPEERRRSAQPARGEWTVLEPLEKPVLPALPRLAPDGDKWSALARRMWAAWRQDPATGEFGKADIDYAFHTIALVHANPYAHAAEVRLRSDALGLTPKGRRDLRLRLPGEQKAQEAAERKKSSRKTTSARRAKLSVVE